MALLSLKAGLRAVEIAGLIVSTKGGKPRTVPVNKDLRKVVQAYRGECKHTEDGDHVFLARHAKPGTPLTANAVAAWFRDSTPAGSRYTRTSARRFEGLWD